MKKIPSFSNWWRFSDYIAPVNSLGAIAPHPLTRPHPLFLFFVFFLQCLRSTSNLNEVLRQLREKSGTHAMPPSAASPPLAKPHQCFARTADDDDTPDPVHAFTTMPPPPSSSSTVPTPGPSPIPSPFPHKRSYDVADLQTDVARLCTHTPPSSVSTMRIDNDTSSTSSSSSSSASSSSSRHARPHASKRPRTIFLTHARPTTLHSGPGPPPNAQTSACMHTTSNPLCPYCDERTIGTPQLPDEVLVSIFRFIPTAGTLARLRSVCRQWCRIIDTTPHVWRNTSFRHATFAQRVEQSTTTSELMLGMTPGSRAVTIAARSGNEWALFLHRVMFQFDTLHAFTAQQPLASFLVSGRIARTERAYPPWAMALGGVDDQRVGRVHEAGGWIAVHAARHVSANVTMPNDLVVDGVDCRSDIKGDWPRGALVGLVHVAHAVRAASQAGRRPQWVWQIDRAVSLKKPLHCAGFIGLWSVSRFLTDLLINTMHSQ